MVRTMKIETILSPAELPAVAKRDLRQTACVVFDILRATSTFVTALQNGARSVIPVIDIPEALALRKKQPDILLAGERDGVKIQAKQSGGVDFDFGNSPREFIPSVVSGKIIASTTTNGTLALRDCAGGKVVLAAAFLNLGATAAYLKAKKFTNVLLVCAGTGEGVAMEDVLAAGAMAELLAGEESDATNTARQTWLRLGAGLEHAIGGSKNGQRLLSIAALREDVAFCAQRNVMELVAVMGTGGRLEKS